MSQRLLRAGMMAAGGSGGGFADNGAVISYFGADLAGLYDAGVTDAVLEGYGGAAAADVGGRVIQVFDLSEFSGSSFTAHISAVSPLIADVNLTSIGTWTKTGDWDISTPGQASISSASGTSDLYPPENGGNGTYDDPYDTSMQHFLDIEYTGLSGSVDVVPPNGNITAFPQIVVPPGTTVRIRANASASITVTKWGFYPLPGAHAAQPTFTTRPFLRSDGGARPYLEFDGVDDALSATYPDLGTACTVKSVTSGGVTTLTGQTISGSYTLPTGNWYACVIIDRALTTQENDDLDALLLGKAGL